MIASHLPILMADGRTVPSAEVHQLILGALNLRPGEKVLEIGTGSGTTASRLASALCVCSRGWSEQCDCPKVEVHTIELEPVQDNLVSGSTEVYFHVGDGKEGLALEAPFDAIVATCGVEAIPEVWDQQLLEGGRMIVPLGFPVAQRLVLRQKVDGVVRMVRILAYVRFSMMRLEKL